jgi:hypothetical protein
MARQLISMRDRGRDTYALEIAVPKASHRVAVSC